jgi:hypothetical protein
MDWLKQTLVVLDIASVNTHRISSPLTRDISNYRLVLPDCFHKYVVEATHETRETPHIPGYVPTGTPDDIFQAPLHRPLRLSSFNQMRR